MTDDLINRTRAALDGVTAGPWGHDNGDGYSINSVKVMRPFNKHPATVAEVIGDSAGAEANARFIAAARDLVPELAAALEAERELRFRITTERNAAEAENAALRAALEKAEARVSFLEGMVMSGQGEQIKLAADLLQEKIRAGNAIRLLDEAEAENSKLAAGQCIFTDGTGLTGDDYGNPICLVVIENDRNRRRAKAAENALARASDPAFIWEAMDSVADMDTTLMDYANAVAKAIAGLRETGHE